MNLSITHKFIGNSARPPIVILHSIGSRGIQVFCGIKFFLRRLLPRRFYTGEIACAMQHGDDLRALVFVFDNERLYATAQTRCDSGDGKRR